MYVAGNSTITSPARLGGIGTINLASTPTVNITGSSTANARRRRRSVG